MILTWLWIAALGLTSASLGVLCVLIAAHAYRAREARLNCDARERMTALCLDALAGGHGALAHARLDKRDEAAFVEASFGLAGMLGGRAADAVWITLAARRAGPALAALATSAHAGRRSWAARGLLPVCGQGHRAIVERLLADSDPRVACAAAAALNDAGADPRLHAMLTRLKRAQPEAGERQFASLRLRIA